MGRFHRDLMLAHGWHPSQQPPSPRPPARPLTRAERRARAREDAVLALAGVIAALYLVAGVATIAALLGRALGWLDGSEAW